MNKATRISFLVAAMLLTAVVAAGVLSAAAVIVAEDQVEWAAANGDDIGSVKPDVNANFFVRDDALQTTKSGTRSFTLGATAAEGSTFNIAAGTGPALLMLPFRSRPRRCRQRAITPPLRPTHRSAPRPWSKPVAAMSW